MEELNANEVTESLKAWLGEGTTVELSRDSPEGRLTGWIMHPAFAGISRAVRQEWLWNGFSDEGALPHWEGLRSRLRERAAQIGLFLTFSPHEYEQTFAEAA